MVVSVGPGDTRVQRTPLPRISSSSTSWRPRAPNFEAEYAALKDEYLSELALDNEDYRTYLSGIDAAKTHNGYFAIDKKTKRLKDPELGARSVRADPWP